MFKWQSVESKVTSGSLSRSRRFGNMDLQLRLAFKEPREATVTQSPPVR